MKPARLRFALAAALLGLAATALAFDLRSLDIGRIANIATKTAQATASIPEPKEIELGRGVAARMLGASPLVADEEVQRYVNRVGRWLSLHTERPDLPWSFGVLDTGTVGAFAAPGGYIFVTRGLMLMLESEAELAGVLAHEIGHVIQRHHLEAIRKQAMAGLATDLVGLAVSQQGFDLQPFIDTGVQLYARGLDRDDEFAADRLGVVIAARAGYEPYGLPRVLLALHEANPGDENLALLFSTHPPTVDRLAQLEQSMQGGFDAFQNQPQVADRYFAIRERLR